MSRSYTPPGHRSPTSGPSGSPLTLAAFAVAATVAAVADPTLVVALALAVSSGAAAVVAVRAAPLPHHAAVRLPRSELRLEIALTRPE
jgi:hypothetical protein